MGSTFALVGFPLQSLLQYTVKNTEPKLVSITLSKLLRNHVLGDDITHTLYYSKMYNIC